MTVRPKNPLLLPLLALSLVLALAASAHAQDGRTQGSSGVSATLQVSFGTAPHWAAISGTRVEEMPQAERPDYDVFRVDGSYYAYNNNQWYMSHADHGDFARIDDQSLPGDLSRVPREHWRNYPAAWGDGRSATLQVSFGTTPRWAAISGTRVEEMSQPERPDFDVFRVDGNYYAYNNNQWYMSHDDHGDFAVIDDQSLPGDLSRVPRDHWRNYPAAWGDGRRASLQVSFGSTPHWAAIRGTRVEEITQAERPDYDLFRFEGGYYAYNNNQWYMSHADHGDFAMIDDQSVPSELSRVPREHWRNYPSAWGDGTSATLQVSFGTTPHWTGIRGTRVKENRKGQRPDYDVFRFDGSYYAYHDKQWYTSHQERGGYAMLDDRSVPSELSRVPRDHWMSYPAGWSDENRTPRGDRARRSHN